MADIEDIHTGNGHGAGEALLQADVIHQHPAAINATPVLAADSYDLQNLYLLTTLQLTHLGRGGAGALADIEDIHIHHCADLAGGGDRLRIRSHRCLQADVLHADPAAVNATPQGAVHRDGFIDLHLLTTLQLAYNGCRQTGAFADVEKVHIDHRANLAGLGSRSGLRIRSHRCLQADVLHADPAAVNATPQGAVHRDGFIDLHLLTTLQLAYNGCRQTGAFADVEKVHIDHRANLAGLAGLGIRLRQSL